jgi:hypothetical protein
MVAARVAARGWIEVSVFRLIRRAFAMGRRIRRPQNGGAARWAAPRGPVLTSAAGYDPHWITAWTCQLPALAAISWASTCQMLP